MNKTLAVLHNTTAAAELAGQRTDFYIAPARMAMHFTKSEFALFETLSAYRDGTLTLSEAFRAVDERDCATGEPKRSYTLTNACSVCAPFKCPKVSKGAHGLLADGSAVALHFPSKGAYITPPSSLLWLAGCSQDDFTSHLTVAEKRNRKRSFGTSVGIPVGTSVGVGPAPPPPAVPLTEPHRAPPRYGDGVKGDVLSSPKDRGTKGAKGWGSWREAFIQ